MRTPDPSNESSKREDHNTPPLLASCQHLIRSNGVIVGREIADCIGNVYPTLASVIPPSAAAGTAFLASIDGRLPLKHAHVAFFLQEFGETLRSLGVKRGHRVALVLPNGPELALAILAVSQWACCVPLSATGAVSELKADLMRCGAHFVIGPYSEGPLPTNKSSGTLPNYDAHHNDNDAHLYHDNHHNHHNHHNDAHLYHDNHHNHHDAHHHHHHDAHHHHHHDDYHNFTTTTMTELKKLAETTRLMTDASSPDWTVHHHVQETAAELGIAFCGLVPDPRVAGPFRLVVPHKLTRSKLRQGTVCYDNLQVCPVDRPLVAASDHDKDDKGHEPNSGHDEALVLFTSGTTGNKKLVAHQMRDILVAATTIALSWQLKPTDTNCNLMPLFHVGGIVRQVYSPLISGGCVICCPSFDADLFWGLLQNKAFNWYYAAPTMHQIILQTGKALLGNDIRNKYQLKMIANAAGGLLPSLAEELRSTFQAAVLPSYGMTECMPISSPPANYDLGKPGTSGVPVGPQVAVLNLATLQPLEPMQEGPICVRGEPCFRGYGVLANDPKDTKPPETFLPDGWFNTGDLGYLDQDGYLYITGRSKEVINRGGEIISPMEVEEAIQAHPDVRACAAFAADHDVLQEMVGIVIVPEPGKSRSLDLPTLHAFISDKLATPKWPQCLVYMEGGLPKSHTNKLLRVKLGSRLGLPEFSDDMSPWARTFEAECPEQGAPLTSPIPSKPVTVDADRVQAVLRQSLDTKAVYVTNYPGRPGALVAYLEDENKNNRLQVIETAMAKLHRYEVPTHVCLLEPGTSPDTLSQIIPKPKDAIASLLSAGSNQDVATESNPILQQVQEMFLELLNLDYVPAPDANFFHIGGNSMRASQLAAKVRRTYGIACSGAEIFHHGKCSELAGLIQSRTTGRNGRDPGGDAGADAADANQNRNDHGALFSSTHWSPENTVGSALFQLLPMFVVFPFWQISRYLLFFALLLQKSRFLPDVIDRDFLSFILTYLVFIAAWVTVIPLVFVAIKWLVIGRYKEGRYLIGGSYYLRWWFVEQCRKLFLRGIWNSTSVTLRWYYTMLGAKIEPGARISVDCDLAEYDLVTVGRDAAVELSTLRGFGVDQGAMILGPVKVGMSAGVGIRSVVAPYTSVQEGEDLGPGTSTYDALALNPKHARVNRQRFPQPSLLTQLFVGVPIVFLVNCAGQIPPMIVVYSLLWYKSREHTDNFFSNWNDLMDWLCDPQRIPFFFGIRLARALLSPFCYMAFAVMVKWLIIGKIQPGRRHVNSEWQKLQLWLLSALFARKKVQAVTDLMGRHYENVSRLYRILGAKVGKRVFWPGNQPVCNGLFDLLEIGDDAVFGSRSTLLCASVDRLDKIVLCAGANVSDNCVVLPGTVVGRNAVLGSNSISREGAYLPSGSVWFGNTGGESACLESGDGNDASYYQPLAEENGDAKQFIASETLDRSKLPMEGDETTLRPFGKAVYLGQAKGYWVLPVPFIIVFSWLNRAFCSIFHTLPLLMAIQLGGVLLYSDDILQSTYSYVKGNYDNNSSGSTKDNFLWFSRDFHNDGDQYHYPAVFWAVLQCFLFTHLLRVVCWLFLELCSKWLLMGRRKPGRYNYDTSSYAQRWEIYQLAAKIRKISRLNLLQFISGTPFMNWYIRLNGGFVGKDCCLFPTGADPFPPEPDLLTIKDGCVIDKASLVCHLNTRGNFQLAPIVLEPKSTLRAHSRVQQGIHMEEGAQLLEKSIAMTGEVIDSRAVWQGSPATLWFRLPESDLEYAPPKHLQNEGIELTPVKK